MSHTQIQKDKSFTALTSFAWLSIGAAVSTLILKSGAYLLTGSVGLLSDAAESIVNLAGAAIALGMLTIAARPPDRDHLYGHNKAEYFASSLEGILILVAAGGILWMAFDRWIHPQALESLMLGLVVTTAASLINFIVARTLISVGRKRNSITLEADGQHLMTDVWTSVGVIISITVVGITGWNLLDPLVAVLVAVNIVWTGIRLIRRSVAGFMDTAPNGMTEQIIVKIQKMKGVYDCHAVRIRPSGARWFVDLHVTMDGERTLNEAHAMTEKIEKEVKKLLPQSDVTVHVEPKEMAET